MSIDIVIRRAQSGDIAALKPVVERAYRGDSARLGWTHEADLMNDERIEQDDLTKLAQADKSRLLIAFDRDSPVGCVAITNLGEGRAYLGLLCIDPELQAKGLGRQLIVAAEETAQTEFSARLMEMTVIELRTELIAYYERRGYEQSGERRDFPVPVDPPLFMTVLEKSLS